MDGNDMRAILPDRLHVVDLEYDIKKLHAEMEYHKSKAIAFEQALKVQEKDLDRLLGASGNPIANGEMYQ